MADSKLLLPVHGFVLAGGKSVRMGRDKAMLSLGGRPLIDIALQKLRSFCASVSICGNREDLAAFGEVVPEGRLEAGPAAGIESGLEASRHDWSVFIPVDAPCVPSTLLRAWAAYVLTQGAKGTRLSSLCAQGALQPAFCMIHRECSTPWSASLNVGERKLINLFGRVQDRLGPPALLQVESEKLVPDADRVADNPESWFRNLNTPEDVALLIAGERDGAKALTEGGGRPIG